jgi:carboxypeptidase T
MFKKYAVAIFLSFILIITIIPNGISTNSNEIYRGVNVNLPYEYYNYTTMTELLNQLVLDNSEIMSLTSIGKTYEGRDIWMVKLSDNVNVEEDEPGVMLMGAHHGDERPGYEVPIYFIKHVCEFYFKDNTDDDNDGLVNEDIIDGIDNDNDGLLDEDPSEDRVREVLEKTEIYIIPMVNPDGVEYGWRKNTEPNYGPDGNNDEVTSYGVDLNRNYGYAWYYPDIFPDKYYYEYISNDNSWVYRGEEAFSEIETQSIKNFVETHDIDISLSYHDYGEWMIFPWMHSSRHVPHEALFRSIGYNMSRINKYELKIYGQYGEREYLIPQLFGTPGSSENWLYGEHEIIAYTIELCSHRPEFNVNRLLDALYNHVGVNLYVCERSWTIEDDKKDYERLIPNNWFYDLIEPLLKKIYS